MEKPEQFMVDPGPNQSNSIPPAETTGDGKLKRLTQLVEGCSVAGLSHATSAASRTARIFWTILMICGVIGCSTNLSFLIREYLRKPILTEISHDFDSFGWPDISFCNPSSPIPFSLKNRDLTKKWNELKERGKQFRNKSKFLKTSNISLEDIIMSTISHKDFHTTEVRHLFKVFRILVESNHLPEYSGFLFKENDIDIDVVKNDWFLFQYRWVPMPNLINCYTFKMQEFSEKYKHTKPNAKIVGLNMMLELNLNDFMFFNTSYHLKGIQIYITGKNHSLLSSRHSTVGTGLSAKFEITQSKMIRIHRKEHCRNKEFKMQIYDPTFSNVNMLYGTFKDCKYVTAQKIYLERCNCYNPSLPIIYEKSQRHDLCLNMTAFNDSQLLENVRCLEKVQSSIRDDGGNDTRYLTDCFEFKSPSCNEVHYTIDQHNFHWPRVMTDEVKQKALGIMSSPSQNNGNWIDTLRDSYLQLNIEAEKDYVRVVKEEFEYPFSKLLSDIGGVSGLWLGLTIVGIFELIEIFPLFIIFLKQKVLGQTSNEVT